MTSYKTKSIPVIITSAIIALMLFSPTTVIPNVSAANAPGVPDSVPADTAPILAAALQKVQTQIHDHPGWIGIVNWKGKTVTTAYVGDPLNSPYYNPHMRGLGLHKQASPSTASPLTVSCSNTLQQQGEPTSFTDSGTTYTTAYHIQQHFNAIKSTNAHVDLLQTLNTLNYNKGKWMQDSIFYDATDCTNTGAGWYENWDSYDTGTNGETAGYPQDASIATSSNDVIYEDAYAQGNGNYEQCVTDVTPSPATGSCINISYSGDNANNFSLGQKTNFYTYDTGTMMEELSDNSSTWNWNSNSKYIYRFQSSSSGTPITTCNGWGFDPASGSVTTSDTTNPCTDTMFY